MTLPSDLLVQAKHLATREPKRPKQASLRRAVSTAYYALFHLLSDDAAALLVRGNPTLRRVARRALSHSDMMTISKSFGSGAPPSPLVPLVAKVSNDLKSVANTFVELQQSRHEADYDMTRSFSRLEALDAVDQASSAFQAWGRIRSSDEARIFALGLFFGNRLRG